MKTLLSCEFDIDTACVELKYADNSMISIDCTAVENELDASMLQRGELDWLIYNKPLEYAQLLLNEGLESYLKGTPEHRLPFLEAITGVRRRRQGDSRILFIRSLV